MCFQLISDLFLPAIPANRDYSLKRNVSLSLLSYRHPERSRGIFVARPPYAHMPPHSNDTLVLPFSPFPHPRFTALQEGSLYFGPQDTQERRIVSYRFSYHSHPIRPCGAPSPRGEGCDTRIPSSKKSRRSRHLNPEP